MKYAVIYVSQTGNTKQLAQHICDTMQGDCVYCGEPKEVDCDFLFVGSWTDKGTCDERIQEYLKTLHHKKIFLFGSAGFGGSQQYFKQIIHRFSQYCDETNDIVGSFMCQGKMPMSVRERYVQLALKDEKKFQPMIDNFDQALAHPNQDDLNHFTQILNQL